MAALVQALSRFSAGTNVEAEPLKILAILSGVGLFVSLLCTAYGLDIGAEFF